MKELIREINGDLKAKSSESNLASISKFVPGTQKIFGVKTPDLNVLAKKYKSGGFELVSALWKSGSFEEKIIAIKILEQIGGKDSDRTLKIVKEFAPQIDNWAVCDGLGMQALKGVRKTHADEIFMLAEKWSQSKNLWERRLSLVMVEWFTRDPLLHSKIKKLIRSLEGDEEYYVRKAVLWINRNFSKGK
jgi:3-methyladenine DNA glycosylase AlkD